MTQRSSNGRLALILADRLAGLTYEVIGPKHGISPQTARRECALAMRRGEVTAEQIGFRVIRKSPQFGTDEAYHRYWLARVMRKVVKDANGCWLWEGQCHPKGYGQTAYRGKTINLHRAMYMVVHGVKLLEEQYVCHTCDVRRYCNPDHLWVGSQRENLHDMVAKGRHNYKDKPNCTRGHPLTPDNVRYSKQSNGRGMRRVCLTCERERMNTPKYKEWARAYQRRRKAALRAAAKSARV